MMLTVLLGGAGGCANRGSDIVEDDGDGDKEEKGIMMVMVVGYLRFSISCQVPW